MKINPDQLAPLTPDAERAGHRSNKACERFEDLLARESEKLGANQQNRAVQTSGAVSGPGSAMNLTATQMLFPPAKSPESETKTMDTIDNLLSQWENYADHLASSPQGLRNAHDILNRISSDIGELKEKWPRGLTHPPMAGLRSMLDELEVLAVTERIKFDRGDYI